MERTRFYRAYGLTFASTLELPSLHEAEDVTVENVDIWVRVHAIGAAPASAPLRIVWDRVCELTASGGNELDLYPTAEALASDLELSVLGAGLALILEQRGILVLHGSCVVVDGVAVALVGRSGAGKSTVAAALSARGHSLVSDGMTAVDLSVPGEAWVLNGPRAIKLLPDAVNALGLQSQVVARVHAQSEKLALAVAGSPDSLCSRLRAVLVLSNGITPSVASIGPSVAAFELTKNFFLIDELASTKAASILAACSALASRVEVRALVRGGLDQLPAVVDLVVSLAQRLRS